VGQAWPGSFDWLQQNIDDITILIHGTPQIVLLAVDSDEKLVQNHRGVPVSS
jgi:hypothetical protein